VAEQAILEAALEIAEQRQEQLKALPKPAAAAAAAAAGRPAAVAEPTVASSDGGAANANATAAAAAAAAAAATAAAAAAAAAAVRQARGAGPVAQWSVDEVCRWLFALASPKVAASMGEGGEAEAKAAAVAGRAAAAACAAHWGGRGGATVLTLAERGPRAACTALRRALVLTVCAGPAWRRVWPQVRGVWEAHTAAEVPPLRWWQEADAVHLTLSLKGLALIAPPAIETWGGADGGGGGGRGGGLLTLRCRGAPPRGAAREYAVRLPLFGAARLGPPSEAEGHGVVRGSQLHLVLKKAAAAAHTQTGRAGAEAAASAEEERADVEEVEVEEAEEVEEVGEGAWGAEEEAHGGARGGWPRLLRDASLEQALRTRGLLGADWAAVGQALEREEEAVAETERVAQNVHWLEDKWARQGRGTLAEQIAGAPMLTAEELRQKMGPEAAAAAAAAATGGGGGGAAAGMQQPPLSRAQQQLLQAGVHPSEVPGLEGGMEIEIDEETIARHAAARKQEL